MTLESELDDLMKCSEKLELENGTLLVCLVFVSSLSWSLSLPPQTPHENVLILQEKLKDARPGEVNFFKIDCMRSQPVDTVNLLATERTDEDGDSYEQRSPVAKLHQLLDAAAAAGWFTFLVFRIVLSWSLWFCIETLKSIHTTEWLWLILSYWNKHSSFTQALLDTVIF